MKHDIDSEVKELIIPPEKREIIREVMSLMQNIQPLSAVDFLSKLKSQGMESPIFKAARLLLRKEEASKTQTFETFKKRMIIGISLDLTSQKQDGVALFYAMDPSRDWKTLYPKMLTTENLPEPPLSPTDIDRLLYYTLIGADYKQYHVQGRVEAFTFSAIGTALVI